MSRLLCAVVCLSLWTSPAPAKNDSMFPRGFADLDREPFSEVTVVLRDAAGGETRVTIRVPRDRGTRRRGTADEILKLQLITIKEGSLRHLFGDEWR